MLDTMIQLNVLAFSAVAGYMMGDALMRTLRGTYEAGCKILPQVANILETLLLPGVEQKEESKVEPQESIIEQETNEYASLEWVLLNAPMWVSDDELEQQELDEQFQMTFSDAPNATVVKPVEVVKMKTVAQFKAIEGMVIEKIKKGYEVSFQGYQGEVFKTLKDVSVFLTQLIEDGVSVWVRV